VANPSRSISRIQPMCGNQVAGPCRRVWGTGTTDPLLVAALAVMPEATIGQSRRRKTCDDPAAEVWGARGGDSRLVRVPDAVVEEAKDGASVGDALGVTGSQASLEVSQRAALQIFSCRRCFSANCERLQPGAVLMEPHPSARCAMLYAQRTQVEPHPSRICARARPCNGGERWPRQLEGEGSR
jgi:hypothetical protein